MRIADLAKELKVTETFILDKIKALKLRAKDGGEITAVVEMILRDALAEEGIGQKVVEQEEPLKKKAVKKTAKPAAPKKAADDKAPVAKKKTVVKKKPEVKETALTSSAPKAAPVAVTAKPQVSVPAPVVKVEAPKATPVAMPVKPQVVVPPVVAPKVEAPKPVVPPPAPAPIKIDVSRIDIPKVIPPFEAVKPLLKKRRRPEDGGFRGRETKPSASIASAVVPEQVVSGPLKDLEIQVPIAVKDFAVCVNQKTNVVLKKLLDMRVFANVNQNLGEDIVVKLAEGFGFNVIKLKSQEEKLIDVHQQEKDDPATLKPRAPVVTFMGHVDHGKTSLLDRIRSAKVAEGEHGGITQHIGAYSVKASTGTITFLDTPGHEAFTAMRARGAHITDVVVLVVAADDGIMPQTQEAIDHARAANVPIIVALNKIDKKTADPDRVKKQLTEHDLLAEEWGGKVGVVGVSALTGKGIDELLERILLEAEILELKANPNKKASGIVIEAHISKGRGAVASLIVQSGTLREGDAIVVGPYAGKIKAMFDDKKRPIKIAGPSTPVEILGLSQVPGAGDMFYAVEDERKAKEIAATRQEKLKNEKLSGTAKVSLEELYSQIQQGEIKEVRVLIKADVQGSIEALKESLGKIPTNEVKLRFMHTAVGDVNASDVILAQASNAIIIAFNVSVDVKARQELEKTLVDVREYRIIYDAVEDVRKALEGLLAPKLKRHFIGKVEIRNVFKLSSKGVVAGCYVQKGKVRNKAQVEIVRNGQIVHTAHISSLKRFKDDVKEVSENFECGITVANYDAIEVGDILEVFDIESIARRL